MLVCVGLSSGFGNSLNKIKCQARLLGGLAIEVAVSRISVIAMNSFRLKTLI